MGTKLTMTRRTLTDAGGCEFRCTIRREIDSTTGRVVSACYEGQGLRRDTLAELKEAIARL